MAFQSIADIPVPKLCGRLPFSSEVPASLMWLSFSVDLRLPVRAGRYVGQDPLPVWSAELREVDELAAAAVVCSSCLKAVR